MIKTIIKMFKNKEEDKEEEMSYEGMSYEEIIKKLNEEYEKLEMKIGIAGSTGVGGKGLVAEVYKLLEKVRYYERNVGEIIKNEHKQNKDRERVQRIYKNNYEVSKRNSKRDDGGKG